MSADRGDQQRQHRRLGHRLIGNAIKIRPERRDDDQRQNDVHRDAIRARGNKVCQRKDRQRQQKIERDGADERPKAERPPHRPQVEHERDRAHQNGEPDGARHLAGREQCIGERAKGDELTLRNEDNAGDREDQHEGKAQQRVDRPVGDPVLKQKKKDRGIQSRPLPVALGIPAGFPGAALLATFLALANSN